MILLALLCGLWPGARCVAQSQVETIIQRSVEANERDWKADAEYGFFERDIENGADRTNHVTMIDGSPYYQLVELNGKPISTADQAKEEQKLQQTIAQRKRETPSQRAARVVRYQRDRTRDHLLMEQLTKAFSFKLEGEQKFGDFEVYVLAATPLPAYTPPNRDTRVLTGMNGKLWIDKKTYQWVRVEAHVIHPVAIEGFLARVEPGTEFELEKMPVGEGIWLPKHFAMKAYAKILGLFSHHEQEEESYWGYHKGPANAPAVPPPAAM